MENRIQTKNINLLDVFGVEPKQHFWWKHDGDLYECYLDYDNHFYTKYGTQFENTYKMIPLNTEMIRYGQFYYNKPIELDENTMQWLKLIKNKYKYIARNKENQLFLFTDKPIKRVLNSNYRDLLGFKPLIDDSDWIGDNKIKVSENAFDIDLSFIKWKDEEPYKISELLEDDE